MNKNEIMENYRKTAETLDFIFGGVCGESIKFVYVDFETVCENGTIQDTSAKYGNCKAIRLHFSGEIKKQTTKNGITIATIEEWENLLENPIDGKKWNKGELFEYLIYKYFGIEKEWKRTNGKHSADIEINGMKYQIKTDRAWIK